jgi:hypothetical protein
MVGPCPKVIGTIDPNTTALFLLFSLVFTKPEVFPSDVVPGHTASVSIDRIAVCVFPSTTGSNPLARCKGGEEKSSDNRLERRHGCDLKKLPSGLLLSTAATYT